MYLISGTRRILTVCKIDSYATQCCSNLMFNKVLLFPKQLFLPWMDTIIYLTKSLQNLSSEEFKSHIILTTNLLVKQIRIAS